MITSEEISKRLSILENKIMNNDHLSIVETLNFVVIAIFVEGSEILQIMENLAYLFSQITKIDSNLQLDIHQVLKKMIKYHFKNNEKKCRVLLIMISEKIFQENYEGLTYKEITELRMREKDEILEQKDLTLEEKDTTIKEQKQEIERLKQQLSKEK